jgi:hypothetical protein
MTKAEKKARKRERKEWKREVALDKAAKRLMKTKPRTTHYTSAIVLQGIVYDVTITRLGEAK